MDLLGPSLQDMLTYSGNRFNLKTTLMIADQLISRYEYIHSKNYIHRDIKPDNFLMGLGKLSHVIYLIDFGLGKRYKDANSHQHIAYKIKKNLTGTVRYLSINAQLMLEHSRRDDLETVGYALVYFLKSSLPWQSLVTHANKTEKYHTILKKKMSIPVEYLCKDLPVEFCTYIHYCRALHFEDRPDYPFLKRLFRELMITENYKYDFVYDWTLTEAPKKSSSVSERPPRSIYLG
jgi:serine/threonine protein kinase